MNSFGKDKKPFFFIIDFEKEKSIVQPLNEIDGNDDILFSINDGSMKLSNYIPKNEQTISTIQLQKKPIAFENYKRGFDYVHENLKKGNSFLVNLTTETPIFTPSTLHEIFEQSQAKYKLFFRNQWVCFSPETFVQITKDGKISSFPMKGTAEKTIPDTEKILLNDPKEMHEHTTIVDLIRNDLSKVAQKVWVEQFRYCDEIVREDGTTLVQVSSEICGQLAQNWKESIGSILFELLPAGSISGAPKQKTIDIIKEAENRILIDTKRGFYTGVFGVFDGDKLNSGVMIRFIEKKATNELVFKSGGGITHQSNIKMEYNELLSKIYVPIF